MVVVVEGVVFVVVFVVEGDEGGGDVRNEAWHLRHVPRVGTTVWRSPMHPHGIRSRVGCRVSERDIVGPMRALGFKSTLDMSRSACVRAGKRARARVHVLAHLPCRHHRT